LIVTEVAQFLGFHFQWQTLRINFAKKNWAYILGDFSQTHLVTLAAGAN
jgi:hypothetical protein